MNKCFFCEHTINPSYKDIDNLEKFLSIRKKIMPTEKSRVCAKHQRKLTKEIKYARFLAILPFLSYHK